jgi:hypothetical protein
LVGCEEGCGEADDPTKFKIIEKLYTYMIKSTKIMADIVTV